MNLLKFFRSLLGNSKPVQRGILLTQKTIVIGSTCILSLGIGGGVVYKEWQTQVQSQRQKQIQINNCYLAPLPSVTPAPSAKPTPKTVTLPESA
ncbi:hypothetical protein [Nostoc sp.]